MADPLSRIPRVAPTTEVLLAALGGAGPSGPGASMYDLPRSADSPSLPEPHPPLVQQLVAAYIANPSFVADAKQAGARQDSHGLWYKDDRVLVPDDASLRDLILQ